MLAANKTYNERHNILSTMITKTDLAKDWLPRYTGTPLDAFGDHILLTNFDNYVKKFATMFNCDVEGEGRPMQTATNSDGILSLIHI